MGSGAISHCSRCAELEEQIAWLKSELGESTDANFLARLRELYGLTKAQARMLEALNGANGRVIPYARLAEMLGDGERDGNTEKTLKVYACHLRKKIGETAVFTSWGIGLAIGTEGVAACDAAKAQVAA